MVTLIDFYADWCGPCHAIAPLLEKFEKEFEGKLKIEKVDVDANQSKAQDYGVMSIPTLVIEKDGKEIDRKMGALPEAVLRQWIESHVE